MSEFVRSIDIGVDTGGTFTDCVVLDYGRRKLHGFKVLSTPHDPSEAIFNAIDHAFVDLGIAAREVGIVLHATTVATNALIERKGSKTGLVATRGFRDVLEMRRETRYDETDLFPEFPEPLVPRYLRRGVDERVDASGKIVRQLDEADLREQLRHLSDAGVEALAISFLHSYLRHEHEAQAASIAEREFAFDSISISSLVQSEVREYERTSTTVANAYIRKMVQRYVSELSEGLARRGVTCPLQIMQSNGGFAGPTQTSQFPVRMVESGPAAGTISAIFHGRRAGRTQLVSFDMGGTTAKIAVLKDETPPLANELEVARVRRFKAGSGIPLRCPSVALNEIGAGGGSIAYVDNIGLLRVGPESAGAVPGPACYGRGGSLPTVTDADLVLGYLDAGYFAGGGMMLDRAAAEWAITAGIADKLDIGLVRSAWGIHDIVNQNMASAARLHILEEGENPSAFTMVAFGGAGPVHAHRIAMALGMKEIIYPANAGVASAFGLMIAPMAANSVQTYKVRLNAIDWEKLGDIFADLEADSENAFEREATRAVHFTRSIDFRYVGQGFEIQVDVPQGPYSVDTEAEFEDIMRRQYERLFGRVVQGVPLEIVNLRLVSRVSRGERNVDFDADQPVSGDARKGKRLAYFDEAGDYVEAGVFDRTKLRSGTRLDGPAIIEERDTTIIIPPGTLAVIDEHFNVIATIGASTSSKIRAERHDEHQGGHSNQPRPNRTRNGVEPSHLAS